MIDSYGVNNDEHIWLGLDPGVTTGWALLTDDEKVVATGNFDEETVRDGLDQLVRGLHRTARTITVVIEKMPPGTLGQLSDRLARVRHLIDEVIEEVYELPTQRIKPGEWKTSRVAKMLIAFPHPTTQHERDAAVMARYAIHKERKHGR